MSNYDPKVVAALLRGLAPASPTPNNLLSALQPSEPSFGSFGSLGNPRSKLGFAPEPSVFPYQGHSFGGLFGLTNQPTPWPATQVPTAPVKRKVFFSFHYDDVRRSVQVRNAWRFSKEETHTFYDSSLWEKRKLTNPEAIKNLIKGGVSNTSTVCVMVGSETWCRPYVRYEIARAVIDRKGLLAIHINGLRDPQTKRTLPLGFNPLACMGVGHEPLYDAASSSALFLYECDLIVDQFGAPTWTWKRYEDYTKPLLSLPRWLPRPDLGKLIPLSTVTSIYDYGQDGHKAVGLWIDQAARER